MRIGVDERTKLTKPMHGYFARCPLEILNYLD
jgi:hypothetical protein